MNKETQKRIEQRIRSAKDEPYNPSDEHIEEIKQRAFDDYEQLRHASESSNRSKKKGILRSAIAVAVAVVCLFAGSLVYAVLTPVPDGRADSPIRKVAIWLNDQFHLGITFYEPINDSADASLNDEVSFTSVEEASKTLHVPIVYFPESSGVTLICINANKELDETAYIDCLYEINGESINLKMRTLQGNESLVFNSNESIIVESGIGQVNIWKTDVNSKAIAFYNEFLISIVSSMDVMNLVNICKALTSSN